MMHAGQARRRTVAVSQRPPLPLEPFSRFACALLAVWTRAVPSERSGLVGRHSPRGLFCHTLGPVWIVGLQCVGLLLLAVLALALAGPAYAQLHDTVTVSGTEMWNAVGGAREPRPLWLAGGARCLPLPCPAVGSCGDKARRGATARCLRPPW
jgi:hypothetical protein